MSHEAKREYIEAIRERYQKGSKKEKKLILDEFCRVCGLSRKHSIRLLGQKMILRQVRSGPKSKYTPEVIKHLKKLWEEMGKICSKKIHAAMPIWLPYYEEKSCTEETRSKLLEVSPAQIDRLLKPYREPSKGKSTTHNPNWIKSKIPIKLLRDKVKKPGYFEADTVAHCGDDISGGFVYSLTMTDLYSGWTENRACWTKRAEKVFERIQYIENNLPFPVLGFYCDNGSEFLNDALCEYFLERKPEPVDMARGRPYRSNDQCHVEQKNFCTVRQLFGYDRLDDENYVNLMNEVYKHYWNPILNFFTPTMKLIKKERIGSRIKKKYDNPTTPYQRLINSEEVDEETKKMLTMYYKHYNPFTLRKKMDEKMNIYYKLVELDRRCKQYKAS